MIGQFQWHINTLIARDVILHAYFSFLYTEDVLIRLSAKFDFDRFSIWYNLHIFSFEKLLSQVLFCLVSKTLFDVLLEF